MKNIVIVDATSTGSNYIADCVRRGYQPVVVWPRMPEEANGNILRGIIAAKKRFTSAIQLDEQADYADTLKAVAALEPVQVIPGGEYGVTLATCLAEDLHLPGNGRDRLDVMTHKDAMQDALRKAGLRYIRGILPGSEEEALDFYRREKLDGCVVKPVRGAASLGVRVCDNEREMLEALRELKGSFNVFGEEVGTVCVQERIRGTEYVVNTVSRDGVPRLSSLWRYGQKQRVSGGAWIYDYMASVDTLQPGHTRLIRYAMDAVTALGIRNGAVHGEYMVDDKGPVLIEVNCRVMGAGMPDLFLDRVQGHHETDNVLDSMLNRRWHEQMTRAAYRLPGTGMLKLFIIDRDMFPEAAPVLSIVRHLRSYYTMRLEGMTGDPLKRTVDMETSGGTVYLFHEDAAVVRQDLEFLRRVEKQYGAMLFTPVSAEPAQTDRRPATVQEVIDACDCARGILTLTNDPDLRVNGMTVDAESVKDAPGGFDTGILDLNYSINEDLESMIEAFYALAAKVRRGGRLVIPERTYWHFPCGIESIEILCESLGLRIEAPAYGLRDVLIATVE